MSFNCSVFIRPLELCCHQHVKTRWILKSTSTKSVLLCCIGAELFTFLLIYFCSQMQQTDFLGNLFLNVLFILCTQKFLLLFQSKTLGEIFHYSNQQVIWWTWKMLDSHRLYQVNYTSIVLRGIQCIYLHRLQENQHSMYVCTGRGRQCYFPLYSVRPKWERTVSIHINHTIQWWEERTYSTFWHM